MDVSALREKLPKFKQSHILDHWDSLNEAEKKSLYDEVSALNLEELMEDFERTVAAASTEKLDDKMQPLPEDQCGSTLKASDKESKCMTLFINLIF
jgi:UDP-N-acetylglucosamine pyrophosphorylase